MPGEADPQAAMFSYVSAERRVPADHPLHSIKAYADTALRAISPKFDELNGKTGRPSHSPERLLKSRLPIALYSVRSDWAFRERLDYNLLCRWFLDMSLDDPRLDQSNFSRLRERLVQADIARNFFDQILLPAKANRLLSAEHFTVDSTLIESWASLKSLKNESRPLKDGGDGTGMAGFKGERRANQTHQSSTDPGVKQMRRGNGQPAKLCFGGHALTEPRSGLDADLQITDSRIGEPKVAQTLLARLRRKPIRARTLGADKGYHNKTLVAHLRQHRIRPHIARIEGRDTQGLDARTMRHASFRVSQRTRKRIEEILGWLKTVGSMRKSRVIGIARTQMQSYLAAGAYNLFRMSRLVPIRAL